MGEKPLKTFILRRGVIDLQLQQSTLYKSNLLLFGNKVQGLDVNMSFQELKHGSSDHIIIELGQTCQNCIDNQISSVGIVEVLEGTLHFLSQNLKLVIIKMA